MAPKMAPNVHNEFHSLALPAAAAHIRNACGIKTSCTEVVLSKPNVLAVGVGFRNKDRQGMRELCIVCSVVEKKPLNELAEHERLPQYVGDFRIDVVATGRFKALGAMQAQRMRPVHPGLSIGHEKITAGTFGLVVERNGERLMLSNNHVLANCNSGKLGDRVLQPGRYDGGKADKDAIAHLVEFVPIFFDEDAVAAPQTATLKSRAVAMPRGCGSALVRNGRGTAPVETFNQRGKNRVDCALALPEEQRMLSLEIAGIGVPRGVGVGSLGMQIQKSGRTTGHTTGQIEQIDVTSRIDYDNRTATFTGQILASAVSAAGDSGSAVLDMTGRVIGLLFAGSNNVTLINPIQDVLDALNVEVAEE